MRKKEKRLIILKDPRLRKIRTELRNLLFYAFEVHHSRYFEEMKLIDQDTSLSFAEKKKKTQKTYQESEKLMQSFGRSVVHCSLCGRRDLDLIYNPVLNAWYCEACYTFNQKCQNELHPPGIYYP